MNAPLYEVKSKFSEYVNLAEQGQVVEVCKYGKPAVVMIDAKAYYEGLKPKVSRFDLWYSKWRQEFDDVLRTEGSSEMADFEKAVNDRSGNWRDNPFAEE